MTKSTPHRCVTDKRLGVVLSPKKSGRKTDLTDEQEKAIAETCKRFADCGEKIFREVIKDLIHRAWRHMPFVKQTIRDGRPGRQWLNRFCTLLSCKLNVPIQHSAERFKCTNAAIETEHVLNLEELLRKYEYDVCRIFNLDETGMSAGRYCKEQERNNYCTLSHPLTREDGRLL